MLFWYGTSPDPQVDIRGETFDRESLTFNQLMDDDDLADLCVSGALTFSLEG